MTTCIEAPAPLTNSELADLAASIYHLSGPEALDPIRLIPITRYGLRLLDEHVTAEYRASMAETSLRAVYRERAHLVALLAALYPSTWNCNDPDASEWPVVYVDLPTGQASWHISPADWWLFAHVSESTDTVWDGHDTDEKYWRIRSLTRSESAA